jgi:hypothetical protein
MSFKRLGSVACALLIAGSLVVPTRGNAYTITGGIGGAGGSSHFGVGSVIGFLPVLALISLFLEMQTRTAFSDTRWPYAPESDMARRPVFNAMQSMMNPNGQAEGDDPWLSYAAGKPRAAMPVKGVPMQAALPWRGFYLGGNLGWGTGNNEWVDTFGDLAGVPGDRLHVNTAGILGGIHGGYEQQFGRWVLGI